MFALQELDRARTNVRQGATPALHNLTCKGAGALHVKCKVNGAALDTSLHVKELQI